MSRPRCEVRVAVVRTLPVVLSAERPSVTVRHIYEAMPMVLRAGAAERDVHVVMPSMQQVGATVWNMSRAGELEPVGRFAEPGVNRGMTLFRPGPRAGALLAQCNASGVAAQQLAQCMRGWFGGAPMSG
jgi:hypothetical protein